MFRGLIILSLSILALVAGVVVFFEISGLLPLAWSVVGAGAAALVVILGACRKRIAQVCFRIIRSGAQRVVIDKVLIAELLLSALVGVPLAIFGVWYFWNNWGWSVLPFIIVAAVLVGLGWTHRKDTSHWRRTLPWALAAGAAA